MNYPLQGSEHSHNPEKGLMELVENYAYAKKTFIDGFHATNVIKEEIQSIADDYERTKQQRDKLLTQLRVTNDFIRDKTLVTKENFHFGTKGYVSANDSYIAECEGDKE